jgi:hypothetical protein
MGKEGIRMADKNEKLEGKDLGKTDLAVVAKDGFPGIYCGQLEVCGNYPLCTSAWHGCY